jgi:hypothetical protein
MALFKTVNPALEGSDPLAPGSYQRVGESVSLATSIAGLFFGSPVGLAAGGTAMVMDLRLMAFPRTDFRSSLAEKMPNDGLALCGKKTPPRRIRKLLTFGRQEFPTLRLQQSPSATQTPYR